MISPFRSINLTTRVLLVAMGLIFAGIWVFAFRISALLQTDIETLVAQQVSSQVNSMAEELDHELQFRIDLLKDIAASMTLGSVTDAPRVQRILDQRSPPSAIFPFGVLAINKEGMVIADYPSSASWRRAGFLGDRDFFQEASATNKPVIGRPIFGRYSGRPIIPISVPLNDANGDFAGVVHAAFPTSDPDLFGKLVKASIGTTGRFWVASPKDNLVVADKIASRVMTPLTPRGAAPMLDRRLYEGFEEAAVTVTPSGVKVIGASRRLETAGWVLIGNISADEAFAPIKTFTNRVYLSALLVSLVTALLLFYFLRGQLSPLTEAGAAMQRMTMGAAPFGVIPVRRDDEIGGLLRCFNRLVGERQRAEDELRDLNCTLEDRVKERTDRLQLMTRRATEAQETEQRRLGRELHDGVSSNLAAIAIGLNSIRQKLPSEVLSGIDDTLSDCTALLTDTELTVRDISSDLHPAVLDYMGLIPALKELGDKLTKRTDISVMVCGSDDGPRLLREKEMALFRIAQEALVNCAKHSGARTVAIELKCDSEKFHFSIKDDGVGFHPQELSQRGQVTGLGLLSMQERAEAIGGTYHIESAPGAGTQISVEWRAVLDPEYVGCPNSGRTTLTIRTDETFGRMKRRFSP